MRCLTSLTGLVVLCLACGSSSRAGSGVTATTSAATEAASALPDASSGAVATATASAKSLPCLDPDEAGCRAKCDAGDLESCMRLASMYNKVGDTKQGQHPERTRAIVDELCKKKKHGPACYYLGGLHEFGFGVPKDPDLAASLTEMAVKLELTECEQGMVRACEDLASSHIRGYGLPKDKAKAKQLEERAQELRKQGCDKGDASLCSSYGIFSDDREYLERGCNGGDMYGCQTLGNDYHYGNGGLKKDPEKARALLAKACAGGVLSACKPR